MKQSTLVSETRRDHPKEELSVNSQLLIRAGYISRLMAGVYSFLPLGKRVLDNIERIVRSEMDALGSQEVFLPALQPKENWERTARWNTVDVLYKLEGAGDRELALGPTHEEVVTPLIGGLIESYKDLPRSVYQVQTKFRNEARPKSGLLRGREFRMKDMYSFHASQEDLDQYYEQAIAAYRRVFARCGLGESTYLTYASGGAFSKYSHEFQTITPHGEDTVYLWREKGIAVNHEIIDEVKLSPDWANATFEELKAIEVGNIFKLGTRFSDAFGVRYKDRNDQSAAVPMGCYGIGTSRLVGAIVECHHDKDGIIWPEEVAPFRVHLIQLGEDAAITGATAAVEAQLRQAGVSFLTDDRTVSAGQKFKDSDLIGIPHRVVISQRGITEGAVELKERRSGAMEKIPVAQLAARFGRSITR